ncbi:MAG: hypothetical protein PHR28_06085 [candidate division Zixibacteria bacterium]|nr:hypothetical protein [candidate division Zixibacteria bacterium]
MPTFAAQRGAMSGFNRRIFHRPYLPFPYITQGSKGKIHRLGSQSILFPRNALHPADIGRIDYHLSPGSDDEIHSARACADAKERLRASLFAESGFLSKNLIIYIISA